MSGRGSFCTILEFYTARRGRQLEPKATIGHPFSLAAILEFSFRVVLIALDMFA